MYRKLLFCGLVCALLALSVSCILEEETLLPILEEETLLPILEEETLLPDLDEVLLQWDAADIGSYSVNAEASLTLQATKDGAAYELDEEVALDLSRFITSEGITENRVIAIETPPEGDYEFTLRYDKNGDGILQFISILQVTVEDSTVTQTEVFPRLSIYIPDENLRGAVLDTLGKAQGEDIYAGEVAEISTLDLESRDIAVITGLGHFTSLTELNLATNQINDVSDLSVLSQLSTLDLTFNPFSSYASLSGLVSIEVLTLKNVGISDIDPLHSLYKLREVTLFTSTGINNIQQADIDTLRNAVEGHNQRPSGWGPLSIIEV